MIFEIYSRPITVTDQTLEWRWRLVRISTNKIIANCESVFETKLLCEADIHFVMLTDYSTPVIEVPENTRSVKPKFTQNG